MATVNIIVEAAEYNAATNRISSALQTLRDEMKSLRHQDLTLMRQLITINDSIKSLGQEQRSAKIQAKRNRNKTRHIATLNPTTPCLKRQTPLVRQQSLPRYFDVIPEVHERRGSMSSEDDSQDESLSDSMTSLDDDTCDETDSISSAIPVFQKPALLRQRSRSLMAGTSTNPEHEEKDESNYETILKNNVLLWKECQTEQDDSDGVFENDSETDQS